MLLRIGCINAFEPDISGAVTALAQQVDPDLRYMGIL